MPTYPDCSYVSVEDTSEPTGASYIYCLAAEVRELKRAAADANDLAASFPIMEPFTECDPYWDQVVLLLRASDNSLIVDATGKTLSPSGDVSISTAQSIFNGKSINFNGGTILTPYSTDFNMTTDYTVEFWLYSGGAGQEFFSSSKANAFYMTLGYPHPDEILRWYDEYDFIDVSGTALNVTLPLPFTGWNHVALTRQGSTVRSFFNGVKIREQTIAVNTDTTAQRFSLGYRTALPAYCIYGYLDQIRITLAARYTEDFPPPTTPFYEVVCL